MCHLPGPFFEAEIGIIPARLGQSDPPQGHTGDVEIVEVGQPLVVARPPLGRPVQSGIGKPGLDVLANVEVLALDHPQIAASLLDPGGEPFGPRLITDMGPVGKNLEHPAVIETGRGTTNHGLHQAVPTEPSLPVDQPLAITARRSHDVGRISDDEVEGVVAAGVVEGSIPDVHVGVRKTASELGHLESSRVDVSGDDMIGMTRQVQGLDAAPAPHVEGAPHVSWYSHLGQ